MIATMGNTADIQLPSRQYCRLGQPAESDQWLTPARQRQWLLALLILGIVARVVRYALRFPLWEDECNLVANYLDADYLSVLRPLKYDTVCPMLFSWVELTPCGCWVSTSTRCGCFRCCAVWAVWCCLFISPAS